MAVLLSVSTSVYGGTMEVHAAEVISDDLLENEVIDNSSSEENTAISINLSEGADKMNERVNRFKLF